MFQRSLRVLHPTQVFTLLNTLKYTIPLTYIDRHTYGRATSYIDHRVVSGPTSLYAKEGRRTCQWPLEDCIDCYTPLTAASGLVISRGVGVLPPLR